MDILRALAAEPRLKAFASLVLGAGTAAEVAARAGLAERAAVQALAQLAEAGLAARSGERWTARTGVLAEVVREARPETPDESYGGADEATDRTLRTFLREGRLVSWPAQQSRRRILLDHFARAFEPGVRYTEKEVNTVLRAFADDHVTLRRYLVDEGFLARNAGEYWRIGGSVVLED